MVDLSLLAAEIVSLVWGTSANFNGFVSWQHYCTAQKWASAKLCGVEQMAPPMFDRAVITLGIGSHSTLIYYTAKMKSHARYGLYLHSTFTT